MLHNWLGLSSLAEYLRAMIHPLWFLAAVVLLYSTLLVILCNAYVSTLLLFIYKKTNNLPGDTNSKLWDNPRKMIASFVDTIGKILHGKQASISLNTSKPNIELFQFIGLAFQISLLTQRHNYHDRVFPCCCVQCLKYF